ncbi:MAG: hypothetical protein DWI57_09270 [Chloroflexi bacterium]|nr:MAG: hypothetical protein DWI57_09270 [Chloroflexota bacterium]
MSYHYQSAVRLDTADARRPQLVVAVPFDQTEIVREALAQLASSPFPGVSAQEVILNALRTVSEQAYFWTAEWQTKEQAADLAIAEGRAQTFDRIDEMIDFLDQQ